MVTSEQFIEKIEQILKYYNLSASFFAEKIGVQRSSLSHLLSGRNKPSLDFVIKIVEEFPEVDLYWFLFNKGQFPKEELSVEKVVENRYIEKNNYDSQNIVISNREILPLDLFNSDTKEFISKKTYDENILQNETEQLNSKNSESNFKINEQKNTILNNNLYNENENHVQNEKKSPIVDFEAKHHSKVKKLLLIYEDGFFEEYNYK